MMIEEREKDIKPQEPQSSQRRILCTKNEYPHKDITRYII